MKFILCEVAWENVCLANDCSGLGVINLAIQNRSLLSKFWSKLLQPPTTSWQSWFLRNYGTAAGRDLGDHHRHDSPTWSMMLQVLSEFRHLTRVHLVNGTTVSFWLDHWLGLGRWRTRSRRSSRTVNAPMSQWLQSRRQRRGTSSFINACRPQRFRSWLLYYKL